MIVVGILAPGTDAMATVLEVSRRAAGPDRRIEVVGVIPADAAGDRITIGLAQAGVGHATVVRTGATTLEPADVELALRYLPDVRAIVLVRPPVALLPTALAAASWSGAPLVLVGPLGDEGVAALSEAAVSPLVIDAPANDPDGTFAGFIAALAVRLDAGDPPDSAFRATVAALAVDPA